MHGLELLTHNGVSVYRVYKDGEYGITRTFWFSLVPDGDEFGPTNFDVRSLPTWQGSGAVFTAPGVYPVSPEGDRIREAIIAAIDQGLLR